MLLILLLAQPGNLVLVVLVVPRAVQAEAGMLIAPAIDLVVAAAVMLAHVVVQVAVAGAVVQLLLQSTALLLLWQVAAQVVVVLAIEARPQETLRAIRPV
jgi:hypothetical protein